MQADTPTDRLKNLIKQLTKDTPHQAGLCEAHDQAVLALLELQPVTPSLRSLCEAVQSNGSGLDRIGAGSAADLENVLRSRAHKLHRLLAAAVQMSAHHTSLETTEWRRKHRGGHKLSYSVKDGERYHRIGRDEIAEHTNKELWLRRKMYQEHAKSYSAFRHSMYRIRDYHGLLLIKRDAAKKSAQQKTAKVPKLPNPD